LQFPKQKQLIKCQTFHHDVQQLNLLIVQNPIQWGLSHFKITHFSLSITQDNMDHSTYVEDKEFNNQTWISL
jgi:hypothetical protein